MERRRVPVDWEDLEMALTWRNPEWTYDIDLRTGHVMQSETPSHQAKVTYQPAEFMFREEDRGTK